MELITIGVIVNTHGLKGNLKVKSFTDFKEKRYKKGSKLYISFKRELIPVTVFSYKTNKGIETIKFEEFDDINECEKYKRCEIQMEASNQHSLEEDEFYFHELIGMDVYTDICIGKVDEVREVPQGELLVIKRENNKDLLIPFNKHFVKDVLKDENKITLIFWEGLI